MLMVIMIGALGVSERCWAQPQLQWKIHDMNRPRPPVVTPGQQALPVPAPSDAVVLFDGKDLSQWNSTDGGPPKWKVENGYFEVVKGAKDIQTKQGFGDVQLHVEWAAPVPAIGKGQGRGNSGILLMGLYEVQVLDSYQNETYADGQAAAAYGQYPPLVNACRSPGEWQAYDIVFRRPRFDNDGKLLQPTRLTVFHNGILVQDNVELWGRTAWLEYEPYQVHADKLPLVLQDHGNPVRFRNIWVRELREAGETGPSADASDKLMALAPSVLDRYVGRYEVSAGRHCTITREGDHLLANIYGTRKFELVANSERKFSLKNTGGFLDFDLNAEGKPVGLVFHLEWSQTPAKKVD
jgi:hypothetical protein